MPEMDYTMVMTGPTDPETGPSESGFINGGMFRRSEAFPGKAPNLVIDVASIDEALREVEAAGGQTVSTRTPVGDMGFTGYSRHPTSSSTCRASTRRFARSRPPAGRP